MKKLFTVFLVTTLAGCTDYREANDYAEFEAL